MTQLTQLSDSSADSAVVQTFHDGRKLLKDGTIVSEVKAAAVTISKEIVSGRAASRTLEKMHRTLGELPDIPQKMNPVAAVIFYRAVGLSNTDIAVALGATETQIATITESELYGQLTKLFDTANFEDAKRNARHLIARNADIAADRVVSAMDSADPLISFHASKEVLKLADVSLAERESNKLSGLHIRITTKDQEVDEINMEIK